ncbi:MAG TPA: CapA family protein [Spirochaetota bacterium]|nr:CapA family protein [Spirochaetota bacterium]
MRRTILFTFLVTVFVFSESRAVFAENFTILTMGDLLIANAVEKRMDSKGKDYPFKKLRPYLEKYDIVVANLETPVTLRGNPHPSKKWTFKTRPDTAGHLKTLNIHVLSLANNHLMDYGTQGLEDTVKFVKEAGFYYSGAGINLDEARKPAILNKNDSKLVFLSYCERPPMDMYAKKTSAGIAPIDIDIIRSDIKRYKGHNVFVFVSLHWGIERTRYPRKDQITTAHAIIDAGAEAIIGHHPHIPQGIEVYKGKPVIYSLGNAVCGFYNREYTSNIMVSFHYSKGKMEKLEIIPMAGDNYKIHFQPYVERGAEARVTLAKIIEISAPFKTAISIENSRGVVRFDNP